MNRFAKPDHPGCMDRPTSVMCVWAAEPDASELVAMFYDAEYAERFVEYERAEHGKNYTITMRRVRDARVRLDKREAIKKERAM